MDKNNMTLLHSSGEIKIIKDKKMKAQSMSMIVANK